MRRAFPFALLALGACASLPGMTSIKVGLHAVAGCAKGILHETEGVIGGAADDVWMLLTPWDTLKVVIEGIIALWKTASAII